jgi:glyoxylase-like metal-dependent hydrolase (beta-lactamase superfamily II)
LADILEIDKRITLIDGHDLSRLNRTGTYVIKENDVTLIETSASPSIPFIKDGLSVLGISLDEIKYIILTHIHLDHAGGAGLFLKDCPNAKVVVHNKGSRHLMDPSRLIAGARAVYGSDFDNLFDPIIPIPAEKIIIKGHLDTLKISTSTTLTFYDTPGHANHHFSIYDPISNGMFAGDTAGIYYRELAIEGMDFYLPSTSPNQFNPQEMINSVELYENIGIEKIFFGHFGVSSQPSEVYQQLRKWLPVFMDSARTAFVSFPTFEEQMYATANSLFSTVQNYLTEKGVPITHHVYEIIQLDLKVSSMGLIDYLTKENSEK